MIPSPWESPPGGTPGIRHGQRTDDIVEHSPDDDVAVLGHVIDELLLCTVISPMSWVMMTKVRYSMSFFGTVRYAFDISATVRERTSLHLRAFDSSIRMNGSNRFPGNRGISAYRGRA